MVIKMAFLASMFGIVSCASGTLASMDGCRWSDFRAMSRTQQKASVSRCHPEQQIALYEQSVFSTSPPSYDLVDPLAVQGEQIVLALVGRMERLQSVEDEILVPELLFVLFWMNDRGYYDVRRGRNVMNRIRQAVDRMTEPELKTSAESSISWIENPRQ
jgi:hypothetical protein